MKQFLICLLVLVPSVVHAQSVVHHPQPEQTLAKKWQWAEEQTPTQGGYWIGYSIERLMDEGSFMGAWSSGERRPRPR